MFCSHCGRENPDTAYACTGCGVALKGSQQAQANPNDAKSAGIGILGFFFPLIGFILWIVWKDSSPLKSKSALKGAIIGFVASFVISFISTIAFLLLSPDFLTMFADYLPESYLSLI